MFPLLVIPRSWFFRLGQLQGLRRAESLRPEGRPLDRILVKGESVSLFTNKIITTTIQPDPWAPSAVQQARY